jgi:hypothetical protein
MGNPFTNKCPVCGSDDLDDTGNWMAIYSMHPITCRACGAKFEPNIVRRVGIWGFVSGLASLGLLGPYLNDIFKFLSGTLVVLSFVFILTPPQFTLWDNRNVRRAIVNYGAVFSLLVIAFVNFWTKGH